MKKIMFNDKYGLTQAVLKGRKTQTRRVATRQQMLTILGFPKYADYNMDELAEACAISCAKSRFSPYVVGEEVAVAQRYLDFRQPNGDVTEEFYKLCCENYMPLECLSSEAGAKNKMFVKADLMPHRIKITNVRIERLQDISDEDCMKEGVQLSGVGFECDKYCIEGIKRRGNSIVCTNNKGWHIPYPWQTYSTPKEAFAALINKTCGKGAWGSNLWVFVYDFELIR